ncbi:MAG: hypothetical protein EBW85_07405 [Burkholderiaceae bacterium]|jgi:hypothetical protein|nr:hypothetical protein [Betaproteobacteria bacterium]NCV65877.1 hypothetical protein [Burkholderiaceae bacterium]NDF57299.1 hypothetical protein [Actinomycetota bacterium]NCX15319.1 hypothetical protein [Burkholderiaceae bacterium]NCX46851.1 hypothetical protein [Burkholderiaceae bacterium]
MNVVEFAETNWLRLTSVLCLGIADILLVADRWWMFFNLFLIALLSELLRKRLYERLLYNYEIDERNRKIQRRKEQAEELMRLKKNSGMA